MRNFCTTTSNICNALHTETCTEKSLQYFQQTDSVHLSFTTLKRNNNNETKWNKKIEHKTALLNLHFQNGKTSTQLPYAISFRLCVYVLFILTSLKLVGKFFAIWKVCSLSVYFIAFAKDEPAKKIITSILVLRAHIWCTIGFNGRAREKERASISGIRTYVASILSCTRCT